MDLKDRYPFMFRFEKDQKLFEIVKVVLGGQTISCKTPWWHVRQCPEEYPYNTSELAAV